MDSVKEKLVELMKEVKYSVFPNGTDHYTFGVQHSDHVFRRVADHLIANGVTVQGWITASEPPKDHKEYIVMIKDAKCPTTLWYRPKQKTWNEACGDKNYDVTHWQYLPQPPKGE